jgi:hypothetical protein
MTVALLIAVLLLSITSTKEVWIRLLLLLLYVQLPPLGRQIQEDIFLRDQEVLLGLLRQELQVSVLFVSLAVVQMVAAGAAFLTKTTLLFLPVRLMP